MKNCFLSLIFCFLVFLSAGQYTTVGTAFNQGNNCYRLTQATNNQNGSVWSTTQVNLTQSFDTHLEMNFGTNNGGADGIAFILHNQSTAVGVGGGGMGYGTISPSIAVEFDTWQNGNLTDPTFDHVGIQSNGITNHLLANNLAGPVQVLNGVTNIEDGLTYDIRIRWDAPTTTLDVFVNCQLRLSYTGDIVNTIFSGTSSVYMGVTASTGGASNLQTVCFPAVNPNVGGSDTSILCVGDTITIAPLNIDPAADYAWIPSSFISDTSIATPMVFPPATTTYYVEIDDTCGVKFDTILVEVTSQYDANFSIDDTFCITDPAFTVTPVLQMGYYTGNGIIDSVAGIFYPDSAGAGTHPITHVIPGNCANDSTYFVTVVDLPNTTIFAPEEICLTDTVVLNAATSGGIWTGTSLSSTGVFNANIGAGTYIINYTINQPCYSQSADTIKVVVPYTPSILNPIITLCEGDSVNIQGIPNNGSLQSSLTPVEVWTGTGIVPGSDGLFDANLTGTGGPYKIFYTVTMPGGSCPGSDSVLVSVFSNVDASFQTGPFCSNDDESTNLLPVTGGGVWLVDPIGMTADTFNPSLFKPSEYAIGQYMVQYVIDDNAVANGCGNFSIDTVTIIEAPEAPIVLPDSICYVLPFSLETTVAFDSVLWYTDDDGINQFNSGESYLLEEGDPILNSIPFTIYTQAFNGICQSDIEPSVVKLYPLPEAAFSTVGDTFLVPNIIQLLNGSSSDNNESYFWDMGHYGLSTEESPLLDLKVLEVDSTLAILKVVNEFGCADTAFQMLYFDVTDLGIYPPNIMTVNGDGCNDVFGNNRMSNCIGSGTSGNQFISNAKDYTVTIFNRWGLKIYEFGPEEYWDGGDHSAGTYFYTIEATNFEDESRTFKGHITLLRE